MTRTISSIKGSTALTSYTAIWNKEIAVNKTAWTEKATSFAATGII